MPMGPHRGNRPAEWGLWDFAFGLLPVPDRMSSTPDPMARSTGNLGAVNWPVESSPSQAPHPGWMFLVAYTLREHGGPYSIFNL